MFNNYTFLPNGNVVAYDDKWGAIVKTNHDRVEEELATQNEIDYLEREIENKKELLNDSTSIKELNIRKRYLVIANAVYIIFIVFVLKPLLIWMGADTPVINEFILNNLPWVKTSADFGATLFSALVGFNFTLSYIKVHFSNKKKIANILKLENSISVLTEELSKKQDELKKITLEKKGSLDIDSKTHDIKKTDYDKVVSHEIEVLNAYLDNLLKKKYDTAAPQDVDENKVKDVKRLVLTNTNQKELEYMKKIGIAD